MKAVMAVLGIMSFATTAVCAEYRATRVDFPGAVSTVIYAVNDSRTFVGAERQADASHRAFVGHGDHLRLIDLSPFVQTVHSSWAYSINQRGDIAGYYTDGQDTPHGYVLHESGHFQPIDFPGSTNSQAYGVNDWGNVTGVYNVDAQNNGRAFLLRAGHYANAVVPGSVFTYPLSINDWDEIAGEYTNDVDFFGYGYTRQDVGRVNTFSAPGAPPQSSFFISVNNVGQILGGYVDLDGNQHNFLKTGASYQPFDLPASFGATYTSAQTVNDLDDIVGYYVDADGVHGYIAELHR